DATSHISFSSVSLSPARTNFSSASAFSSPPSPCSAFSPFKLLLSLSSSFSLLALLLPPPPLSSRLRRRPHRHRLEDDARRRRTVARVSGSSLLALLLSGLEDDEQWLGFPGPPSSRCSPGFPPPKGCLISSSINSWSSSRKR
ncbi:hypothetical protein Drorol1_Dr00010677, partial [Drosera rotundifolia]